MLPQCGGGWVEGMKARQRHELFVRRGNHAHQPGDSGGPAVAVLVKGTGELIETALGACFVGQFVHFWRDEVACITGTQAEAKRTRAHKVQKHSTIRWRHEL